MDTVFFLSFLVENERFHYIAHTKSDLSLYEINCWYYKQDILLLFVTRILYVQPAILVFSTYTDDVCNMDRL